MMVSLKQLLCKAQRIKPFIYRDKLDWYYTRNSNYAAFKNIETQLLNCNATFKDVVKMNTYIVHFNPETDLPFRKIRNKF
jgi:hypothetical protein